MKCIIIEDEQHSADHLEYLLKKVNPNIAVEAKIDSVKNSVLWLKNNKTDLIFLDIQLGDGISFSIFENVQINTPIIFTTSYDEYAIQAFKVNSIAYLLKPIDTNELKASLDKYQKLYETADYEKLVKLNTSYQKRFLIQKGNMIQSINANDVMFFQVENRNVFIHTKDGNQYLFDITLESLEKRLNPDLFFRVNRQFIISLSCIDKMYSETRGRVRIETHTPVKEITVSIDRASEFKNWLKR